MNRIVLVIVICSMTVSCQRTKEKIVNPENKAAVRLRTTFFDNLVAPSEVAAQISLTSAEFDSDLMSDPKAFSHFVGNEVKAAANMGIYLSDFNYAIAFDQNIKATAYFDAARELSVSVGIEKRVLQFLIRRYQKYINENDTVKRVALDLLESAIVTTAVADREKLAAIAIASYQIENLHLVLGTIIKSPRQSTRDGSTVSLLPLSNVVLKQHDSVRNIYRFLESVSDVKDPDNNPNYPFYKNAFMELLQVYERLNAEGKSASETEIGVMNDKLAVELNEKVSVIRNKILSIE